VRRLKTLVALGTAAVVGLTACTGSDGGKPEPRPTDDGSAHVDGGTFTIAVPFDPGSLNPFTNYYSGNDFMPIHLAYEPLIALDAQGNPSALLAEKWEATTTDATFTLREGITCSDGSPLTATNVADNINFAADEENASVLAGSFVQLGTKATADDATRTITVKSGAADAFLLANLGSLPIVCGAGLANHELLDKKTYGTSLFTVSSVVAGSSYTLERRKDYTWGPGDWSNNQPGLPDKIVVKVVSNTTTAANLLLAKDVNFAIALDAKDAPRLSEMFQIEQPLPTGVFLLNEAPGRPFNDPNVRKAVIQGLDLTALGAVIGGGQGQPTKQINEYFLPNVCPGETTEGIPAHDVDAANAALDAAGWVTGPDGIRVKDGEPLRIVQPVLSSFPAYVAAAELQQEQLKKIGVKLVTNPLDGGPFGEAFSKGNFDLGLQTWSFPNPSAMVSSYTGKTPSEGGGNVGDVHNATYEGLVRQAAELPGQEGCDLWNQAEEALIAAVDVVPFWSNPSIAYGNGAEFSMSQFTWSIRMTAE